MCGRLGVVTLVALSLVLAALSVEAEPGRGRGRGRRRCPKSESKFLERIGSCYDGMMVESPVDDMAETCRRLKKNLKCLKRWTSRCSRRSWIANQQANIDSAMKANKDAIRMVCSAV